MTSSPENEAKVSAKVAEDMRLLAEAEAREYKPSTDERRQADRLAGEIAEELLREGIWDNRHLTVVGEEFDVEERSCDDDPDIIVGRTSNMRYEVEVDVHVRCLGPVGWQPPGDAAESVDTGART